MPYYINYFIAFFCLLTLSNDLRAADSTAIIFAKGLQAQNNGQYKEAIQLYSSLIDGKQVSASLYNNLGLAYINNKELGLGIVQLERALKIDAQHEAALHNLKAAQQRIEEQFGQPKNLFFVRWWNNLIQFFSSTAWGILFLLFITVGTGFIAAWRWNKPIWYRTIGVLILIFSFLPLFLGFQQKTLETSASKAIIIKNQVGLRSEPALSSQEIELIFEGVQVDIISQEESWVQIKLSNNLIGWLPYSMLERI